MSIDFGTFSNVAPAVMNARLPVLMRGRHGIGKSQVVYQIAKSVNLPVIERRASQMTEGDLIGLPVVTGNTTRWNPPDWFKQACDTACVLFFDEVDRATLEVRQGLFELTDSRKLNGFNLHKDTLIFAAINGGKHGANYTVSDMDPAELDRYTVFDLEPTVDDWLSWAKDNVEPLVVDFIRENNKHLEHNDAIEPNKVYPSRRSWARLSDTFRKTPYLDDKNKPMIFALAYGFVGTEAAVAFAEFVSSYEKRYTVEDILNGKIIPSVKTLDLNTICGLIEKLEDTKLIETGLDDSQSSNLAEFFALLGSEAAMKLVNVVSVQGSKNSTDVKELYVVKFMKRRPVNANGKTIGELIAAMSE